MRHPLAAAALALAPLLAACTTPAPEAPAPAPGPSPAAWCPAWHDRAIPLVLEADAQGLEGDAAEAWLLARLEVESDPYPERSLALAEALHGVLPQLRADAEGLTPSLVRACIDTWP
ncbi:hypothetical protein ACQ5SO_14655 [Rhodovulum sp. DZ06]|uniref:hypothetical protein n=1 Tax=Rhodovulum sp. DZ06 TaxID=3425126 RepID=UPI003D3328AD